MGMGCLVGLIGVVDRTCRYHMDRGFDVYFLVHLEESLKFQCWCVIVVSFDAFVRCRYRYWY